MVEYLSVGCELSFICTLGPHVCARFFSLPPSSDLELKFLHLQADMGGWWARMNSQCEKGESNSHWEWHASWAEAATLGLPVRALLLATCLLMNQKDIAQYQWESFLVARGEWRHLAMWCRKYWALSARNSGTLGVWGHVPREDTRAELAAFCPCALLLNAPFLLSMCGDQGWGDAGLWVKC